MTTLTAKLKNYSSKQLLKIVEKNEKDERYNIAFEILVKRGVLETSKKKEKKAKKQSEGLSLEAALKIQENWRKKKKVKKQSLFHLHVTEKVKILS